MKKSVSDRPRVARKDKQSSSRPEANADRPAPTKSKTGDDTRAPAGQRAYRPALTLRTKAPTFSDRPPAPASTPDEPATRSKTSKPPPRRDSARARVSQRSDGRRESRRNMPKVTPPESRHATRKVASAVVRSDEGGKPARRAATAIPRLLVAPREILKLRLDHRAGFILSNIDGQTNVSTLVALASIPRDEVEAILCELVTAGAISFAPD